MPFLSNEYGQYYTTAAEQYQFSDYYGTLALVYSENAMKTEWQRYSKSSPDYITDDMEEEF